MMRSMKYQMLMQMRNLGSILLVLVLFIPYTYLIMPGDSFRMSTYYAGMCFGVYFVLSIMFHFSTAATLVRLVLGYGATRKGWFWANVVTKLAIQALACAIVAFVAIPLGTLVFDGPAAVSGVVTGILGFTPLILAVSMVLACISEAAGYVMSRFSGKVLIFVVLIAVGIIVAMGAFLVFGFGLEYIMLTISTPAIVAVCVALCVAFQFISWRLIHKLPAA